MLLLSLKLRDTQIIALESNGVRKTPTTADGFKLHVEISFLVFTNIHDVFGCVI